MENIDPKTLSMDKETIGMVLLVGCRCRCGHEWLSRDPKEKPRVCPNCKTPNWDRPRQFQRGKDGRVVKPKKKAKKAED